MTGARLGGFDDLRFGVIALVVLVHANVTYSGIGSWYYVENPTASLDLASTVLMGTLGMFLQAWFLGVLFFVAGLLAPGSFDRKGRGAWVRDRALRLGGPFLLFVLVITPAMLATFQPTWLSWDPLRILSGSGPLWFCGALLVFNLVWAVLARPRGHREAVRSLPFLTRIWFWLLVALATGLGASAVRVVAPVGEAVLNFQFCFFVGYAVLFVLGTVLGRGGRLASLPSSWARLVWITPLVSVPLLLGVLVGTGVLEGDRSFLGGGSPASLAYALWESFTAVAMTLGLVVRARDRSLLAGVAQPGPTRRFLRQNGFGVYVLHTPVLWGLSLALAGVALWPPAKALAVAALTLAATLGLSALVRRVPGLGRLLS